MKVQVPAQQRAPARARVHARVHAQVQVRVHAQVQVQVQVRLQLQLQLLAQNSNLRPTAARIEGPVLVSIDAPWLAHVRTQTQQHGRVDGARPEQ